MCWWRAASPAKQLRRVILQLTIIMQVVITGRTNEAERLHTFVYAGSPLLRFDADPGTKTVSPFP